MTYKIFTIKLKICLFCVSLQHRNLIQYTSMKPKRIILIRHGESQANVDKYLFGRVPDYTIELTEKGHEQAKEKQ